MANSPRDLAEIATFGAGCFWCLDAVARRITGVLASEVGYAGGAGAAPDYWTVHRGDAPGFIEAVQITFASTLLSFVDLLDLFFQAHDPTTPNQDGANFGPEYHSTIFYHSEPQRRLAENGIHALEGRLGRPVVTTLKPYTTFYSAEPEHQDFYNSNPAHSYCRHIIVPKLRKAGVADE